MTKKSQSQQREVEVFLGELAEIFRSSWQSLSLSSEHVSRLEFEVQGALTELRKILLSEPTLNESDFKSLCDGIRAAAIEQANQMSSRIDAVVSAENAKCEKLRKDIEQIEADRKAFATQPDVIESRRQLTEVNQRIEKLQGELAHVREMKEKLVGLCRLSGIDPRQQLTSDTTPSSRGHALWLEYQSLHKTSPKKAIAFLRKHESKLRAYSESLPASGETK